VRVASVILNPVLRAGRSLRDRRPHTRQPGIAIGALTATSLFACSLLAPSDDELFRPEPPDAAGAGTNGSAGSSATAGAGGSVGGGGRGGAGGTAEPTGGTGQTGGAGGQADAADGAGGLADAAEGAGGLADAAGGTGGEADATDCVEQTRRLIAAKWLSVDYGPAPADAPRREPVEVSRGVSHDHEHDTVSWFQFDLTGLPEHATLRKLTLSVYGLTNEGSPTLVLYYADFDLWNPASASADDIFRTASVGNGNPLRTGLQQISIEMMRYAAYWAEDLADNALSVGVGGSNPGREAERWGELATPRSFGVPPNGIPTLEVVTCE
jgi:hypothetical protein